LIICALPGAAPELVVWAGPDPATWQCTASDDNASWDAVSVMASCSSMPSRQRQASPVADDKQVADDGQDKASNGGEKWNCSRINGQTTRHLA